jgi:hypothetical protein
MAVSRSWMAERARVQTSRQALVFRSAMIDFDKLNRLA